MNVKRTVALVVAGVAIQGVAAFEYNKLYTMKTMPLIGEAGNPDTAYYFDSVAVDGKYPRLDQAVREGGWSDIWVDPTDPSGQTFYSINDRGLNVAYEDGVNKYKVFPFPGYHQKLIRFQLSGDSLAVLRMDSIQGISGDLYTTGVPSSKAPTGEIALRQDLDSAKVDTSAAHQVAADSNGYDFEGIVQDQAGNFYLADEYGPFIVKVDSATRKIVSEWYPGHGLPAVLGRRNANRGMEGLAITPSGKLVGIIQSPLYNPNKTAGQKARVNRIVWFDPQTGTAREYAYVNSTKGGTRAAKDVKIGSFTAIDENRFLVVEHGPGKIDGVDHYYVDIFMVDLSGATDVSLGAASTDAAGKTWNGNTLEQLATTPEALDSNGIVPVRKSLLVGDLIGTTAWPHSKPEGLAIVNDTTIVISCDNDYGMTDYDADGIPHILPANEQVGQILYLKVPSLGTSHGGLGLTLLHNNDGESEILPQGDSLGYTWGGAARFKSAVDTLRSQASGEGRNVVVVSSGDNFLAGKEWSASLSRDPSKEYYDALFLDQVDYDAVCIGNHDFDFGPDVLAKFIGDYSAGTSATYLSSNLDFSSEDTLQALVTAGRLAKSKIVTVGSHKVGIVGATTPMLPYISSPRQVAVDSRVATVVQSEINQLLLGGADIIILVSHLQSMLEDQQLAAYLEGVDIMVAGGGDELLADSIKDDLRPWDPDSLIEGAYPTIATDASGNKVPVVTTQGGYAYVGRLMADFDGFGRLDSVLDASGPVAVKGVADAWVKANVEDSVTAYVAGLTQNVVATSEVVLDGIKNNVRSKETNLGDLAADALLWTATQMAASIGADTPQVALQNGGGIRIAAEVPAGDITEAQTFDIYPFANYVTIVEDVPVAQFKEILENAYSRIAYKDGRFAQVAGLSVVYDSAATAQELDASGLPTTEGERIWSVILDNGLVLVDSGRVVDSSVTVDVATIDFLANGGDQYPFRGLPQKLVGVGYQSALEDYLVQGLSGEITAADYPVGGEGRIILKDDLLVSTRAIGALPASLEIHAAGSTISLSVNGSIANLRLQVLSLDGRILRSMAVSGSQVSVDMRGEAGGVYLVQVDGVGLHQSGLVNLSR